MANDTAVAHGDTGLLTRLRQMMRQGGPGWLLSAYTLGSGSAIGSLWAGSKYGYSLLWVQPISMLMGVVMLTGAAYVAIRNKERPYQLFWSISPALALAWALGSLFASVIWHFPQYGLVYKAAQEILGFQPSALSQLLVGGGVLAASTALTWSYAAGSRGLKVYEGMIKGLVWLIVLCLVATVVAVDIDWPALFKGLFGFHIPADQEGRTIVLGTLSAAVGINMTFLYPYSVRSHEWGEEGDPLRGAVGDLFRGMFLPFVLSSGLLVVASAATIHAAGGQLNKGELTEMGKVFVPLFGSEWGPRLLFIGILAMPLSSITLHMLTCGFIVSEMAGKPLYGLHWKLGSLVPAVGALGVATTLSGWLPVAASALTLVFLPIAYVGFVLLFQRQLAAEGEAQSKLARLLPLMWAIVGIIGLLAAWKVLTSLQQLTGMFGGG